MHYGELSFIGDNLRIPEELRYFFEIFKKILLFARSEKENQIKAWLQNEKKSVSKS